MTDEQFAKLLVALADKKADGNASRMAILSLVLAIILPGLAAAAVWGSLQADVRHNGARTLKNEERIEQMQSQYVTKNDLRAAEARIQSSIQGLRKN